jgi:ribonuclease M5
MKIEQIIVAEGRDDEAAILRAVDAAVIVTRGYGISGSTLELIGKAYREKGIIVFTDPDHAGANIRNALTGRFPRALQAYLTRGEAEKSGDIGIENASPDAIRRALERALSSGGSGRAKDDTDGPAGLPDAAPGALARGETYEAAASEKPRVPLSRELLAELGLAGGAGSMRRREAAGARLGIGGGNANAFLKKLNAFSISEEELRRACEDLPPEIS